jgi:tetratricopeptide (TPR) repeat protein
MRLPAALLALALPLLAAAQSSSTEDAVVVALRDKDAQIRLGAARILASYRRADAVEALVHAVRDEQDAAVKTEMFRALRHCSGQQFGEDAAAWEGWLKQNAGSLPRPLSLPLQAVDDSDDTFMVVSIIFNILLFVIILGSLVAFGAMASNRMKAMKELTKSAESIVREGVEVQQRSDTILAGLDAKKGEIAAFFSKLKEENEGEIERYSDLMEQNVEHRMREITMRLREKAEKELEHTFNELKSEIKRQVESTHEEHKNSFLKDLGSRQQRFLSDVEAHTLFLEASFYYINGKLQDALRVYKKLLQLKPDHYIAWNNYGTILRDLLRFEEAEESYKKALELSPDNPSVLYLHATLFALQKKKEKMMEFLKKSITFDSEFKDEALNDKAFKEYWEDAEFKDVAEA